MRDVRIFIVSLTVLGTAVSGCSENLMPQGDSGRKVEISGSSALSAIEYCSHSDAAGTVLGDGVFDPLQFWGGHPGPPDEFESTATYTHRFRSAFAHFLDRPFLFEYKITEFLYNADSQRMVVGGSNLMSVIVFKQGDERLGQLNLYNGVHEHGSYYQPRKPLYPHGFSSVMQYAYGSRELPEDEGFGIDPESARRVKSSGRIYFVATIKDLEVPSKQQSPWVLAAEAEIHCVVFADGNGNFIANE